VRHERRDLVECKVDLFGIGDAHPCHFPNNGIENMWEQLRITTDFMCVVVGTGDFS
jgi:hypothetical protein